MKFKKRLGEACHTFKKNKKGTDKLISVYWFAILFIVAAGVVYMAALFYGQHYDVRKLEAEILTDKIADCIFQNGELISGWDKMTGDDLLKICNLNFNVEDTNGWKNDQIFARISFTDFGVGAEVSSITIGNVNLENSPGKGIVSVERNLYSTSGGNQYIVKIKSVVRKTEKNE